MRSRVMMVMMQRRDAVVRAVMAVGVGLGVGLGLRVSVSAGLRVDSRIRCRITRVPRRSSLLDSRANGLRGSRRMPGQEARRIIRLRRIILEALERL